MIQLPVGQAKELVREIVAQLLILQGLARRAPQLGHLGVVFGALELCVFPTGRPLRRSGQQGVDQSSVLAGGMPHQAVDSLPYWLAFFAWVGQQRYVLWKEQEIGRAWCRERVWQDG